MANIGTFTSDGDRFTGTINTLALSTSCSIQPIDKAKPEAPDYRVFASGAEIGAAWLKTGKGERPYLAVKLDDPSFTAPIFCRLIEGENDRHQLLWSR